MHAVYRHGNTVLLDSLRLLSLLVGTELATNVGVHIEPAGHLAGRAHGSLEG